MRIAATKNVQFRKNYQFKSQFQTNYLRVFTIQNVHGVFLAERINRNAFRKFCLKQPYRILYTLPL